MQPCQWVWRHCWTRIGDPECGDAVSTLTEDGLRHREIKWRGDLDVGGPRIENAHIPAQSLKQGSVVSDAPATGLGFVMPLAQGRHGKPLRCLRGPELRAVRVSAITPWASTRLIVSVTGVAAIQRPFLHSPTQRLNSADSTRQRAPS